MPRNIDLYWFIPALAKSRVGSECGTTEEDGTINAVSTNIKSSRPQASSPNVCSFFLKYSMKVSLTRTAGHCSVETILGVVVLYLMLVGKLC